MTKFFQDPKSLAALLVLNAGENRKIQIDPSQTTERLIGLIADGRETIQSRLVVDTLEDVEELADSDPGLLSDAWKNAVLDAERAVGSFSGQRRLPRIALNMGATRSPQIVDRIEQVAHRLIEPGVNVGTLMIDRQSGFFGSARLAGDPISSASWSWPMKIGVLGAQQTHGSLAEMVRQENDWFRRVSRFGIATQDAAKWDVLLLPTIEDPHALIGTSASKAQFVVTRRNPNVSYEETLVHLAEIADLCGASGAAAIDGAVEWADFMRAFVREMTHDVPVHGGVWNAAQTTRATAPIIVGWPNRLDRMRVYSVAEAYQVSRRQRETNIFESLKDENFWEYAEPSRSVSAVDAVEFIKNGDFDAENAGGVPAIDHIEALEADRDANPPRYVSGVLYGPFREKRLAKMGDREVSIEEILETPPSIVRDELHLLAIRITSKDDFPRANIEIDPPKEIETIGSLDLTVRIEIDRKQATGLISVTDKENYRSLYERCKHSGRPSKSSKDPVGAVQTFCLPKRGDSNDAVFGIMTSAVAGSDIECRIIISLNQRTIQEIEMTIPVEHITSSINLRVLNEAVGETNDLFSRKSADLGFHVYDGSDGKTERIVPVNAELGITFDDFSEFTRIVSKNLEDIAYRDEETRGWTSKELASSLGTIARHGVSFRKQLSDKIPGGLEKFGAFGPSRISLSGPIKKYVPIEFVYDGKSPKRGAKMCNHSSSFAEQQSCDGCPNSDSVEYVCPLKFWGLSRLIERAPLRAKPDEGLSAHRQTLKCSIEHALFAKSNNASSFDDGTLVDQNFQSHLSKTCRNPISVADNWAEWRDKVTEKNPDLLVAMPHVDKDNYATVLTLGEGEGDDYLRSAVEIENADIGPSERVQLIALLGCETSRATQRDVFVNFPDRFYDEGGDMVIATLATIRGADAYPIARDFSELLSTKHPNGSISYSQLLLSLRRRSLVHSNPAALAVVGYGNADIELEGTDV